MSEARISAPGASTTMDSIRFRSWRTLPGQGALDQPLHRLGGDAPEGAVVRPGELPDEAADQERDVVPPLPQRRQVDVEDVEPVVQVVPELAQRTASRRVRLVAASTRTSTLIGWVPPTRKKVRLSSTRSSFTWVAGGISPISSRKMVPAVGQLEPAQPALGGAGEGALLVAEQLATRAASRAARRS